MGFRGCFLHVRVSHSNSQYYISVRGVGILEKRRDRKETIGIWEEGSLLRG